MISAPAGTAAHDITVSRVIPAARRRVWAAWTSPDELAKFFGPQGTSVAMGSVTMDVREGGALRLTVIEADGARVITDGIYLEVQRPQLLRWQWTASGALATGVTTITLGKVAGGTEVTSRMVGHLGPAVAIGYRRGVTSSLQLLERHLLDRQLPD